MARTESVEERVLVLAPTGRDAEVTREVLGRDGVLCHACADLDELLREVEAGAGVLLITEEAIPRGALDRIGAALGRQESWSDLPVIIAATEAGARDAHRRLRPHLARAGSITILERPIPPVTLLTTLETALSACRRQYQVREILAELHENTRRLEEERRLRERFVAILAHDLRGPLSNLTYGIDLLARNGASPERRGELGLRLARQLLQMDRMIRDLLDVQRIQAGRRLPLRLARCELCGIAREVAEELNGGNEGPVIVRAEGRVEGIWGAEALHRALWNLASNAIKYGASGMPIEITCGRGEAGAWVSVHNLGPPIPLEDQRLLFEPFRRTELSESGHERGWGLGLALVRGTAQAHGGTVEVESLAGKGTTFILRLPWDARPFQGPEASLEPAPDGPLHAP